MPAEPFPPMDAPKSLPVASVVTSARLYLKLPRRQGAIRRRGWWEIFQKGRRAISDEVVKSRGDILCTLGLIACRFKNVIDHLGRKLGFFWVRKVNASNSGAARCHVQRNLLDDVVRETSDLSNVRLEECQDRPFKQVIRKVTDSYWGLLYSLSFKVTYHCIPKGVNHSIFSGEYRGCGDRIPCGLPILLFAFCFDLLRVAQVGSAHLIQHTNISQARRADSQKAGHQRLPVSQAAPAEARLGNRRPYAQREQGQSRPKEHVKPCHRKLVSHGGYSARSCSLLQDTFDARLTPRRRAVVTGGPLPPVLPGRLRTFTPWLRRSGSFN